MLQTWQGRSNPFSQVQPNASSLFRFEGVFTPYRPDYRFETLPPPDRTTYRTLCVRMCDGFYFPISFATTSGNFAHDAERCASACGGDARLFYHPNPGGDVESMVDQTGRAYGSYPTAFRYRKALVQGCQCRPQPWSEAERARHRNYAATQDPPAENAADSGSVQEKSDAPLVAKNQPDPAAGLDAESVNQPDTPFPPLVTEAKGNPGPMMRPAPIARRKQANEWNWSSANPIAGITRYSVPGAR